MQSICFNCVKTSTIVTCDSFDLSSKFRHPNINNFIEHLLYSKVHPRFSNTEWDKIIFILIRCIFDEEVNNKFNYNKSLEEKQKLLTRLIKYTVKLKKKKDYLEGRI